MNGRGYAVLHVHNESSASGQAQVQRSQLSGIPFVYGYNQQSAPALPM